MIYVGARDNDKTFIFTLCNFKRQIPTSKLDIWTATDINVDLGKFKIRKMLNFQDYIIINTIFANYLTSKD